jgi:UDP-glucose 4-epimerase
MAKVLITGGAGFIGSALTERLCKDHEVTVLDNFFTGKRENLTGIRHTLWEIDIRDALKRKSPGKFDVIFHLAALARIQPSFDAPKETYDINSTGTIIALEIAREMGAKLIYAGSSSFYFDPLANPYSYSKWLGEEHCKLYNKIYGVPTAIARFFNIYGPRQIEDGPYSTVIGIFEKQYREKKPLTITGDGEKRRDFTNVSDIVDGLIAISKDKWDGTVFNLGTGKNYSINELAKMFKGAEVIHIPERRGEAEVTLADISFIRKMLGWKPKLKLKDYISEVISPKVAKKRAANIAWKR